MSVFAARESQKIPNPNIFPPTPPLDPELPPRLNSPTRHVDSLLLGDSHARDHGFVGDDAFRERAILCLYFLKNPHLVPEHSPCRLKSFHNVQNLREHIVQDHKLQLRPLLANSTELEQFQDVWIQIFAGHQGDIPHPYLCDREFLRKQQNFRIMEIHEMWIRAELCNQSVVTMDGLEKIFERFRKEFGPGNKFGHPFLPGTVPSVPNSSVKSPVNETASQKISEGASNHQRGVSEVTRTPGYVANDSFPEASNCDLPVRSPSTNPLKSLLTYLGENVVERVMNDIETMEEREYWDSDEEISDVSTDSFDSISTLADEDQDEPSDAGEHRSQRSGGSNSSIQAQPSSSSSTGVGNGKRRADDSAANNDNGNGDGDGRKRQRPLSPVSSDPGSPSKRFSCPYFKKYPDRPKNRSCCNPPGFEDVNRVKEHLYRVHKPVSQCPRCYMEFISVDNVMDHLAGEERCNQRDPRERRDTQSISTSQEKQLKSKRGMRGSSQEERWRKVYRIVFVLEESADTPSPYFEQSSCYFEKYKRFSRQRLPQLIRTELEREMEEHLRNQVISIIQRCQESLFSLFQEAEESGSLDQEEWNDKNEEAQEPNVGDLQLGDVDWSALLEEMSTSFDPNTGT